MAKKDLKATLEKQIADMLAADSEPSEGRMKLIALGIKMCALNAKLEESDYGEFFRPDDESGSAGRVQKSKGLEPSDRSRAGNGADS